MTSWKIGNRNIVDWFQRQEGLKDAHQDQYLEKVEIYPRHAKEITQKYCKSGKRAISYPENKKWQKDSAIGSGRHSSSTSMRRQVLRLFCWRCCGIVRISYKFLL
ncbi:Protein CBG11819 [Caenorhabditis briggsae]|uniref:Protein CBG11819 n=1 Tax=Caenorhabditis briggsae TaxID=6238 RepID=A8XE37_CAEBR|nr:Protein CBG11819 [Caenorhabditis briggsae]CAP30909.1 Protein CBG11819 [Caenorhabditis briggsae]